MSLYLTDRTAYWRKMKKKQRKRERAKNRQMRKNLDDILLPSEAIAHGSPAATEAIEPIIPAKSLDDILKEIEGL